MFKVGDRVAFVKGPPSINGYLITHDGVVPFNTVGKITGPGGAVLGCLRYPVTFETRGSHTPLACCLRLVDPPKEMLSTWASIQKITEWNPLRIPVLN